MVTKTIPMSTPSKPSPEHAGAAIDDMNVTASSTTTSLQTVIPSIVDVRSPLACWVVFVRSMQHAKALGL